MNTNAEQEDVEVKKTLADKNPTELKEEVWYFFFYDVHLPIFCL
jgi:hypothetical protein